MKIKKTFTKIWDNGKLKEIEVNKLSPDMLIGKKIYVKEIDIDDLQLGIEKINKRFDDTIEEYTAKYPIYEKMTWAIKQQEAQKVMNGETSPYLEDLVRKRLQIEGKTDEEINKILQNEVKKFAEIILEKAKEYADLYSKLEAEKDKKIQELKMQLNIQ